MRTAHHGARTTAVAERPKRDPRTRGTALPRVGGVPDTAGENASPRPYGLRGGTIWEKRITVTVSSGVISRL